MQVILPSAFTQSKDRKKVLKSTSNSHIGTTAGSSTGQYNYSMSPSKTGYLVDGKAIAQIKGKSPNQFVANGVSPFNSQNGNIIQTQIGQNQQQTQGLITSNGQLSLSQSQNQHSNMHNHLIIQSSQQIQQQQQQQQLHLQLQQQQQQQQQQVIQAQLQQQLNSGSISNTGIVQGGNFSASTHQSSEKKQQTLQLQLQQQLQMQKSSTSFAKFKDLFGSKRLSEANAKQFLENSNFNSVTNNSANFNKSSRITAQLQVNKMTAAAGQSQNSTSGSNNQKSIISPKRAQIMNHGYIIEDKKKKGKQQQYGDQTMNQPQNNGQQIYSLQQQALLSASQPYFKLNRDSNKQSTTASEDNLCTPNQGQNTNSNFIMNSGTNTQTTNPNNTNNNQIMITMNQTIGGGEQRGVKSGNITKSSMNNSTNGLLDSTQNRNVDINKLAEYKKQLESQLESVNTYIDSIRNFSIGQQGKNLTINVDAPLISLDEKNILLSKKQSLDEVVLISGPQSVRNTKDSNHNSNSTTQGSSQHIHHSNNNSVQFFNFNKSNGIAGVSVKDESQQGELNGSSIRNQNPYSQAQVISQETRMVNSQKLFPKTATSRDNTSNQMNNNQQFFLSTKATQNKTHVKRLTLDSTFSQTLQSQRMPTSNNQLSSILSQSTHHFNYNNLQAGQQVAFNPNLVISNIVSNEQDVNINLTFQLNRLKERISKVLTNYKINKDQSDKLNSQLMAKLNILSTKNASNTSQQLGIPQTNQVPIQQQQQQQGVNQVYHAKSNSFQQLPQQAMPLHVFNGQQKQLSQSQQFFLAKSCENQQIIGGPAMNNMSSNGLYGNVYGNNQMSMNGINQLQQNQNINQNQVSASEMLKKEYYSNNNNQNLMMNQAHILQQHNGNPIQQHIIIDSTQIGQINQNNYNIQMSSSKNQSQSPPFSTTNKQKSNGNILIQSPGSTTKQFQFYSNQVSNNGQRIQNNINNNQYNQQSPQQQKNISEAIIQQQ